MKTQDILLPALRRYKHNDCSRLVSGFDYGETIKIVDELQSTKDALIKDIATSFYYYWSNAKGSNTSDGFDSWWEFKRNTL